MIDRELGPYAFEHLRLLLYSPDEHGNRLPFPVFERDDDLSEAHEPFEEVAGIDPAVIVFPANLFARFSRAFLNVHIIRCDRHVIEKPPEPGKHNR